MRSRCMIVVSESFFNEKRLIVFCFFSFLGPSSCYGPHPEALPGLHTRVLHQKPVSVSTSWFWPAQNCTKSKLYGEISAHSWVSGDLCVQYLRNSLLLSHLQLTAFNNLLSLNIYCITWNVSVNLSQIALIVIIVAIDVWLTFGHHLSPVVPPEAVPNH